MTRPPPADVLAPLRGSVVKPLVARLRGEATTRSMRAVEAFHRLPGERQRAEAFERLRALLVHARDTVPFWADRMREARFDPVAMRAPAELGLLPPLTRAEIIAHAKGLVSTAYDPSRLVVHRSGGTTSEPVPFFQARESLIQKNGAADALRRRMGWGVGDRSAWLWGATRDMPREAKGALRRAKAVVLERILDGALYLPAGDLSDARLDDYVERLRRFRPAALQGYPSATDLLARRLLDRGQRLPVPLVVLTAEPSNRGQRRRIAEALEADVLTFYGARECGWIASECRERRRLHVNTAGIHLEATEDRRLLVTDLWNPAMPLIRYEIGDRGVLDETPCPCGDPRPVLARLEGREVDVFTLPSGRRVPGVLSDVRGVGFDAHGILDAQFVQHELGRLDVHWVPGPDHAPNDLEAFRHHVSELFFGELEVVLHREERIQPAPNGKVRHCISHVTASALAARTLADDAEDGSAYGAAPERPPPRILRPARRRRRIQDGATSLYRHLVKPLAASFAKNQSYHYAPAIRARLTLPRGALEADRLARVRRLLVHAHATVPFWRERMDAAGFRPSELARVEDLAVLPPLTRADVTRVPKDLLSCAFRIEDLVQVRTGGSTSAPVPFLQTRHAIAAKDAAAVVLRTFMGWVPGLRRAYLWGAAQDGPPVSRQAWRNAARTAVQRVVWRDMYLSAGDLSDARLDAYIDRLRRFRPMAMQGYPSATDRLARRLEARGERLDVPIVLLTAEPVLDDQRERIHASLGAEVFTFYGARECGWIASETERCRRLHVNTAGIHLETTPDGRILVTDLVNRAMPLIRYEIGDRGAVDARPCSCGDARPVLDRIEGRVVDVFVLPSGRLVPGVTADRTLRWGLGIVEWQLVQDEPTVLDVRYVRAGSFVPGDLGVLRERLDRLFFGELTFRFHEVTAIQPAPNGKVRYCICNVRRP